MKSLREGAERRIDERMEAIDAARTDALNAITAEVEVKFLMAFRCSLILDARRI